MAYEHGEKPGMIIAHQLGHHLINLNKTVIGSQKRMCVLTIYFILSEHVNAFPRTNVHKERGSLFSGEVTEVNPIDLSNSKTPSVKRIHVKTESNMTQWK